MIRLFIADDHPVVREGLRHVIARSHDITVVGEAADAESVLRGLGGTVADVLLLDVTMPGPGILEIIAAIKDAHPRVRVLVLSVHPEELYARRVLKAGADGYLTKTQSSEALASAIRQVHGGGKYVSPSLAQTLAVDLARKEGDAHQNLSNREYQVFLEIGSGSGIAQIAQQLRLSPKTVRTYRSRILEKMNLQSTAELIFYAVSNQLVSRPADRAREAAEGGPARRGKRQPVAALKKTKR
jgi:DNA-binding NarL/FixJ family response regulator